MRLVLCLLLAILVSGAAGCTRLVGTSHAELREGAYRMPGNKGSRVYVQPEGDTLIVSKRINGAGYETLAPDPLVYPAQLRTLAPPQTAHYYQPSFDVDVLTIPFKYRPAVSDFPAQLNSSFNAAIYLGYRTDGYRVSYRRAPTGLYRRHITHFGTGLGAFAGLGSTPVNPWVTQPAINSEYDGLVIPTGIAMIIAVNDLSFGIMLGIDHLMDEDRAAWIYRRKPWIGASFGLNLN